MPYHPPMPYLLCGLRSGAAERIALWNAAKIRRRGAAKRFS
jgi:hypothetical protein